jgi:predicted DNA-binding transcriptional regulator YafY
MINFTKISECIMPVNRNALIRYRTIDNCLRNKYRKWTLEDLIDACSEALYEYEGIDKGVSRRTVQMDIQMMRSDKLGYNAPIVVIDKKYYAYEDSNYSITNIPLTEQDLGKLTEVIEILKQFKGFTHFQELTGMVQKLEDKIHTEKTRQTSVIQFETNEYLKGLEHIDVLYQSIIKKNCIAITYQSFKARESATFDFHAYLLKEFRNRWFVLGGRGGKNVPILLALDRIIEIKESTSSYRENTFIDLENYFKNIIGVSVSENGVLHDVELFVNADHAPYILTKPLHHTQKVLRKVPGGIILGLTVQLNFELEKEILSFGEIIKVLKPENLVRRIKTRAAKAYQLYTSEIHPIVAKETIRLVERYGSAILEGVYDKNEIIAINKLIREKTGNSHEDEINKEVFAIRKLISAIPELKPLIFNAKLKRIVQEGLGKEFFLSKAIYFDKPARSNWFVSWHQDVPINVDAKIPTYGFSGWTRKQDVISVRPPEEILKKTYTIRIHLDKTDEENGALYVITKSHNNILDADQIRKFTEENNHECCSVPQGAVHFMKPLTLHSSKKSISRRPRRVIHLEFTSAELPGDLKWAEKAFLD